MICVTSPDEEETQTSKLTDAMTGDTSRTKLQRLDINSDKFKAMLEQKSRHTNLIDVRNSVLYRLNYCNVGDGNGYKLLGIDYGYPKLITFDLFYLKKVQYCSDTERVKKYCIHYLVTEYM